MREILEDVLAVHLELVLFLLELLVALFDLGIQLQLPPTQLLELGVVLLLLLDQQVLVELQLLLPQELPFGGLADLGLELETLRAFLLLLDAELALHERRLLEHCLLFVLEEDHLVFLEDLLQLVLGRGCHVLLLDQAVDDDLNLFGGEQPAVELFLAFDDLLQVVQEVA